MATLTTDVKKFKGGSITDCFEKWANIAQDQFVLNIVKFGLTMKFTELPVCKIAFLANSSLVETEIIDVAISKLLCKDVIVNFTREPSDNVSRIIRMTKKDCNYRMILTLKMFNEVLKFKHCELESIEGSLDLITDSCYFGSVDFKDRYYSILIHENYQKYLKLFWKEKYYQYIVLPNGFSPAIRVFTKVLTPSLNI